MKVALVYDGLFPHRLGGVERWYQALALELSRRGHDVAYVTCRDWEGEHGQSFEVVDVASGAGKYAATGSRRILPAIRFGVGVFRFVRANRNIDIVHTASFPYFSVFGAYLGRLGRRPKVPLVVDAVEVWSAAYWRSYLGVVRGTIGWVAQGVALRMATRVFAFSETHRKRLRDLPAAKLPGLFVGRTAATPAPTADPPQLIFVGRLIPEKGAGRVAAIVEEVRRTVPVVCLIVGSGPEEDSITRELERRGLSDVVRLERGLDDPELRSRIAESVCLLHPSEREGYGLVVVEAAAVGTPVLTLAGPDNAATELIVEGVNGWVMESEDPRAWAKRVCEIVTGAVEHKREALQWANRAGIDRAVEMSADIIERTYRGLTDARS